MSAHASNANARISTRQITGRKGREPIVCLTAYTAPMAEILDPICDMLLVGDSVGMVVHGMANTVGVTMEMMILHGQAVMRASRQALVVVDMPFGSYEGSPQQAFASASRVMAETGCAAIKLEGGQAMAETIAFLTARGIPVMAHVGLTPQAVNQLGGYGARGRNQAEYARILDDATAVAQAGAFAMVLEGVVETLADAVTANVDVPVIGIGASAKCDGQVLVTEDMLGLFERTPRFVKRYAAMADFVAEAAAAYAADVRARAFPTADQIYVAKATSPDSNKV